MPIRQSNHVTGYLNIEVAYTLIQHKSSINQLAIPFPEMGYSTEAPLFRYAIGILLESGYDAQAVN